MSALRWAAVLLAIGALSFWVASAVHFGLAIPLGSRRVADPFPGAAIPEAILGFVCAGGVVHTLAAARPRWQLVAAAALFAFAVTLFGLSITVRSARTGDVAYHLFVLVVLASAAGLSVIGGKRHPWASAR